MDNLEFSVEVNTGKQILSSETKIYKTERFFYQTKKLSSVDNFILKISESLQSLAEKIKAAKNINEVNCFKVETFDKSFSFFFRFGFQCLSENILSDNDIIFCYDNNDFEDLKSNDQRVNLYLKANKIFKINIRPVTFEFDESDFNKLYYISNAKYVNFPMLSAKQQELINIENQNVLVSRCGR